MLFRAFVSRLISTYFNSCVVASLSYRFEKFLIILRVNISLIAVCDLAIRSETCWATIGIYTKFFLVKNF